MQLKDITKLAVMISEDATFEDALKTMVREKTNSLLVLDDEGKLSGELSVSDLLAASVPDDLDGDSAMAHLADEESFKKSVVEAKYKLVSEFMSPEANPVLITDDLMAVAASALASGRSTIPVVDHENHPVGVISRRGIKHIIAKYLGVKDDL